jgi:hypothetical protein
LSSVSAVFRFGGGFQDLALTTHDGYLFTLYRLLD